MKNYIMAVLVASLCAACEQKSDSPTPAKETTVVTPGSGDTKETNNTTVVTPPATDTKETSNTTVTTPSTENKSDAPAPTTPPATSTTDSTSTTTTETK